MPNHEELIGEFDYERNVFGEGESRKVVAVLSDGTVVTGKAFDGELESGITYLFRGNWKIHPKYGKQFNFYSFGVSQPVGERGTISYLRRGPGIGTKRARMIWELYGQGSLDAIRERPEEVAAKVKGLTQEQAKEAATYFQVHKDREVVTRDLEELLSNGGFPKRLIDKLIEKWGAKAAVLIRENPFRLMLFRSVGFSKADRLYLRLGGDPVASERCGWCAFNALHKDRDGSTWKDAEFVKNAVKKHVEQGNGFNPLNGVKWAVEAGHIAMKRDDAGKVWFAEKSKYVSEVKLANQVYRAIKEGVE